MKRILPIALFVSLLGLNGQEPVLKIEQVMTSQELQQTGTESLARQLLFAYPIGGAKPETAKH